MLGQACAPALSTAWHFCSSPWHFCSHVSLQPWQENLAKSFWHRRNQRSIAVSCANMGQRQSRSPGPECGATVGDQTLRMCSAVSTAACVCSDASAVSTARACMCSDDSAVSTARVCVNFVIYVYIYIYIYIYLYIYIYIKECFGGVDRSASQHGE